jgi:hypothetical protein
LPVVAVALKVMVFGAVKFESGTPKLHVGKSTAPAGEAVTAQVRVTEPAKEFAPITVMRHVPD